MSPVIEKYVLAHRPRYGLPAPEMFRRVEVGPPPSLAEGQVLVRTLWLSLDAHLYGRVARVSAHLEPMDLGAVMLGATVGRVEASRNPGFKEGELVCGAWGWQSHHVTSGLDIHRADPEVSEPSHHLSALGLQAFAAYIAVTEYIGPREGETITFGAALGGLGQMVGQLSKLRGARVIAITSGAEKCRIATQKLAFDVALDRRAKDFQEQLGAAFTAGGGVDGLVMAVGPGGLKAALPHFRRGGRVVVAGLIGSYSGESGSSESMGSLLQEINVLRLSLHGVVAKDYLESDTYVQFRRQMKQWLASGEVRPIEDTSYGLLSAPAAYCGIFRGKNRGKALVRVAE